VLAIPRKSGGVPRGLAARQDMARQTGKGQRSLAVLAWHFPQTQSSRLFSTFNWFYSLMLVLSKAFSASANYHSIYRFREMQMAQLPVVQITLGSLQELKGPHFCDPFPRRGSGDNEKRRAACIANIVPMRGSKVLRPAESRQEPSHEQIKSYVILW
jgi:hypothetical protein